jgi:hypothetical protein
MHGGASLSGRQSPRRTHGLYAKDPGERFVALTEVLRAAGYTVDTEAEERAVLRLSLWYGPRWLRRMFVPLAAGFAECRWKVRSAQELACFVLAWDPEDEAWLAAECAKIPSFYTISRGARKQFPPRA